VKKPTPQAYMYSLKEVFIQWKDEQFKNIYKPNKLEDGRFRNQRTAKN
jgi:hypothetical protein